MKYTLPRTLTLACIVMASGTAAAAEVYTWRNSSGSTTYSDTPNRLQPGRSNTVNVRTHTVYQPEQPHQQEAAADSLSEEQRRLNEKISQANRQIEEQNKKVEEANRQKQDENCSAARLNRQFAETARAANRDALIQRYDADIGKYCQ